MNLIDISWPISEKMTAYKDRSIVAINATKTFEHDNVRETVMRVGSHSGTHIDAPSHFVRDGKTIDMCDITATVGPCIVADFMHIKDAITEADVKKIVLQENDILLCKTRNSTHAPTDPFDYEFVYVDASAAEYLAQKKIKAVGIDYLGIERNQPNHQTHTTFMRNNITIIEGLRLQHVAPGRYTLWCLPLHIVKTEAAPARAVLVGK